MDCSDFRDMLGAHALGALASPDREALEAHLGACADCRDALQVIAAVADRLAYAAPPVAPPPGLKARLMEQVRTAAPSPPVVPPARPRRVRTRFWQAACAALAVGLAAAIAWGAGAQAQLAEGRTRLAALERQLEAQRDQLAVLRARDVRMAALAPQAPVEAATARFIWSVERKAWLVVVSGLAPADEGKTYQLWAVTPESKRSLGVFQPGADGEALIEGEADVPPTLVAAAVSIEPVGGVPQPTGPIVMVGALPR